MNAYWLWHVLNGKNNSISNINVHILQWFTMIYLFSCELHYLFHTCCSIRKLMYDIDCLYSHDSKRTEWPTLAGSLNQWSSLTATVKAREMGHGVTIVTRHQLHPSLYHHRGVLRRAAQILLVSINTLNLILACVVFWIGCGFWIGCVCAWKWIYRLVWSLWSVC